MTPVRTWTWLGLAVWVLAARGVSAGAEEALVLRGKPVATWVAQLASKKDGARAEAIEALGDARDLVGGPEAAVPVLLDAVKGGGWADREVRAVWALGRFGPLAASALPTLKALAAEAPEGLWDLDLLATRALLGESPVGTLDRLLSELDRALIQEKHSARVTALRAVGHLGLRADGLVARLLEHEGIRPLPSTHDLVTLACEARTGASALARFCVATLRDPELVMRSRAVVALAWMPGLASEDLQATLKVARTIGTGWAAVPLVEGLALHAPTGVPEVVDLLAKRSTASDPALSAWALAGLARLAPAPAAQVPPLRKHLRGGPPEARVAAAHGLLRLGAAAAPAEEDLRWALTTRDVRLRWRAAAWLLGEGKDGPDLIAEVRRGVDGADDQERVLALAAVDRLGRRAAALHEAVRPWAAVVHPLIAGPARGALAATRPDPAQD